MAITIGDIAKHLNLSISTVSKALNGYPDVSDQTRALVIQKARELGYEPSASARNLRRGRTDKIGLLINHSLSYVSDYLAEVIVGVAYSAEQNDKNITLYTDTVHHPEGLMRICRSGEIDGAILLWANPPAKTLQQLDEEKLPYILFGRRVEYPHTSFVAPNNKDGAYQLTRHLIEQGHTRIGFMTRPEHGITHDDRFGGYCQALTEASILLEDSLVVETHIEPDSGYKAMQQFLALDNPPTAVFAFYDLMAVDALRAIHEHGLSVPDDIALVGFDGLRSSLITNPPLTTVKQPLEEMGREAVRLLLRRIDNPDRDPDRRIYPVEMKVRASSCKKC